MYASAENKSKSETVESRLSLINMSGSKSNVPRSSKPFLLDSTTSHYQSDIKSGKLDRMVSTSGWKARQHFNRLRVLRSNSVVADFTFRSFTARLDNHHLNTGVEITGVTTNRKIAGFAPYFGINIDHNSPYTNSLCRWYTKSTSHAKKVTGIENNYLHHVIP